MKKSELRKIIRGIISEQDTYEKDYQTEQYTAPILTPGMGSGELATYVVKCPPGYYMAGTSKANDGTNNPMGGLVGHFFQGPGQFTQNTSIDDYDLLSGDPGVMFTAANPIVSTDGFNTPDYSFHTVGYITRTCKKLEMGQAPPAEGITEKFCCDQSAFNFGMTAQNQPVENAETYIMQNGPQGDMCDNNLCAYTAPQNPMALKPTKS